MKYIASALLLVALLVENSSAFSVGSSMSSAFGGSVLVTGKASVATHGASIEMKKGKDNVPPAMRAQYKKQREMRDMREQMMDAQTPGADGFPVFNLFIRSPRGNMWYPCGSFKGDDRSSALCNSWKDGGLLSGTSKNQLDAGVAGSLFRDQGQLKETICRAYPQLRKSKDQLEFGYKLAYNGLNEEQTKMSLITPKEQKGFIDGIKSAFGQ